MIPRARNFTWAFKICATFSLLKTTAMQSKRDNRTYRITPFIPQQCYRSYRLVGHQKRQKNFSVVFLCFKAKVFHLEIVQKLTLEALIATLKRFIGQTDLSQKLLSDNGANFIGARPDFLQVRIVLRKISTE